MWIHRSIRFLAAVQNSDFIIFHSREGGLRKEQWRSCCADTHYNKVSYCFMLQGYGFIYSIYQLTQIQAMNKITVSSVKLLKLRKTDEPGLCSSVRACVRYQVKFTCMYSGETNIKQQQNVNII